MSIQVPPPDPSTDFPQPPADPPSPAPVPVPTPDPRPPVEPDPGPLPSPQPPGVDAPLKDAGVAGALTEIGLEDVSVRVVGDVAVLRGVVDEPPLQDQAARLAGAIDGVERVRNEIGLPSA